MRAMTRVMLFVLSLGGVALAQETPSPALLVLNKGHWGSTRYLETAAGQYVSAGDGDHLPGTQMPCPTYRYGRAGTRPWAPAPRRRPYPVRPLR